MTDEQKPTRIIYDGGYTSVLVVNLTVIEDEDASLRATAALRDGGGHVIESVQLLPAELEAIAPGFASLRDRLWRRVNAKVSEG